MERKKIDFILNNLKHTRDNFDDRLFYDAFELAHEVYKDQYRANGQPVIENILEILDQLRFSPADETTFLLALFSKARKYTDDSAATIQRIDEELAHILKQYDELARLRLNITNTGFSDAMAQMFFSIANSPRVTLVRLSDRLINVKTAYVFEEEQRNHIAQKAMKLYVPLSEMLNLGYIHRELRDNAFRLEQPHEYKKTRQFIKQEHEKLRETLEQTQSDIHESLSEQSIEAEITSRVKGIHSSYKKLEEYREFPEKPSAKLVSNYGIPDILGIRILVDDVEDCYTALSAITDYFEIHDILKDYIAQPRDNGYASLHFYIDLEGETLLEVQIRTHDMHHTNEYGSASHFFYKLKGGSSEEQGNEYSWVKTIVKWQESIQEKNIEEIDYFNQNIYVLTPENDIVQLPQGAVVLDFAYAIHDDIGHNAVRAYVNDQHRSLDHELKNGNTVRVETGTRKSPPLKYLDAVKTTKAARKMRKWTRSGQLNF